MDSYQGLQMYVSYFSFSYSFVGGIYLILVIGGPWNLVVKGELDCPVNLDSDCKRESTADTGLPNWCAKNLKYCTNRIWQYSQMEPKSFWKRQISIIFFLKSEVKSVQLNFVVKDFYYCDFTIDFLANSYIIFHAKSFKMRYTKAMYLNVSLGYS